MKYGEAVYSLFARNRFFYISLLAALVGWMTLYHRPMQDLLLNWDTEDYSYCYLVPFLFLYLVYEERDRLQKNIGGAISPGYVGLAMTASLYLAGILGSLNTLVFASMWVSLVSLAILLLGMKSLKSLGFPFLIAAFMVPAPPFVTRLITFKLRLISSSLAVKLLQFFDVSAYREGNIIDLGFSKLQVVDACSGLRYVLPAILIALVIGCLFRKRWWERAALALLSVPIAVFVNAVRIVAMGLLAKYVSPRFTEEGFLHDFSGWFIFMLLIAFLLASSYAFKFCSNAFGRGKRTDEENVGEEADAPNSTTDAVDADAGWSPVARHGFVFAGALLSLFFVQSHLVGSEIIPPRSDFSDFPLQVGDWTGQRVYLSQDVLNSLWADDYVLVEYRNKTTGNSMQVLIPYYEYQTTQHAGHAPASCLLGGGWSILSKKTIPPDASAGRSFSVQQMLLEKDGGRLLSNFWFQQRGRVITSEYMNKWRLFQDAVTRRRTDGAVVRLELLMLPGQSVEEGQRLIDGFSASLSGVIHKYVPD